MKVIAKQTGLSPKQRELLHADPLVNTAWQVTPGVTYVVFALSKPRGQATYGDSVLYWICDDYDRLVPAAASLFEVVDSAVSPIWRVSVGPGEFQVAPQEFFDNPHLAEELMDGEREAVELFDQLKEKLGSTPLTN